MKLKRDEFKTMLKECILELVQEGKIFQGSTTFQGSQDIQGSLNEQMSEESNAPNDRLAEAVRITTHLISKGDTKTASMYESIIADTARTTLQKQLAANPGMNGGFAAGPMATPEEQQFDQAQLGAFANKNRWAQLAFGKKS